MLKITSAANGEMVMRQRVVEQNEAVQALVDLYQYSPRVGDGGKKA